MYQDQIAKHFNIIVAENAFKFDSIQPRQNIFNFEKSDPIVLYAEKNKLKLRGHCLLWHKQLPDWVTKGNWSREEAIALLKNHISTIVGRYKGQVVAWDVVNEAIDEKNNCQLRESFWYKTIGPDYIEIAFRAAHEADPEAKLYYNDYGAEAENDKSNAVYELVKNLKKKGVPIHGIGWQCHFKEGWQLTKGNENNFNRLVALGLELSITELTISLKNPITVQALASQAESYRQITQFYLAHPEIKALLVWNFTDKFQRNQPLYLNHDESLIMDADYQPKPAYQAMVQTLAKYPYPKK
jgi:endo-1,4-beta-xylanase